MKKFLNTWLILIVVMTVLLSQTGHLKFAGAQPAGQGLEISPPLVNLNADPGQVLSEQIRIRNVTSQTLAVRAQYDDFVADGEDGQPKLLLEEGEASPYSIRDWLSSINRVTLAPHEQKTVKLTITVPKDASPGGHYGVIRFTGAPPESDESAVSLSASVGSLVLVRISGDVKEEASIAELYTADTRGKKREVFEYGPVIVGVRVENSGNIHLQPTGTIRVTNMLNKEVGSLQVNQNKGNVLPESIRKFEQTLDKKLLFGRYKIQADLVYGTDNQIITATKTFWVIPYKLILIAVAIIAALIFLIRGYNKMIVRKASRNSSGKSKKAKK